MENEERNLRDEGVQEKIYRNFFAAGQDLINVALMQMPEDQCLAITGAVAAGHSELEILFRYTGARAGDAVFSLRTGEQVVELARLQGRPSGPPTMRVH